MTNKIVKFVWTDCNGKTFEDFSTDTDAGEKLSYRKAIKNLSLNVRLLYIGNYLINGAPKTGNLH